MKNFLKIAFILVLGFVIYSCSKENDNFTPEDEGNDFNSPFGSRGDGCDIDTENTFDFAGQIHNEVSVEFLNQYPKGIEDMNEMFAITGAICLENDKYIEHYGTNITHSDSAVIEKIINDSEDNYSYSREIIRQKNVSDLTKDKLLQLVDFVVSESQQEREPDYKMFDSKLANFERDIMNSNDFSPEESELILSSISIARHSACLWNSQLAGEYMTGRKGIGFWGWIKVIVSDIVAYIEGGGQPTLLNGLGTAVASIQTYVQLVNAIVPTETGGN